MLDPPPPFHQRQNTWRPSSKPPHPKFQSVRYMSHVSHAVCTQLPNTGNEWLTSDISQCLHRSNRSAQSPKSGPPSPLIRLFLPRAKFHILKMEAVSCSETLFHVHWTIRTERHKAIFWTHTKGGGTQNIWVQCLRLAEQHEGLEKHTKFWSQILNVRGNFVDLDVSG